MAQRLRRGRRGTVGAVLAALAFAASATALPPQGVYEGCSPGATRPGEGAGCLDRLSQVRQAGLEFDLNYSAWYGSEAQVRAYADRAQQLRSS